MALKGDRLEAQTDISFFMNEVAERGGVAVYSTAGSGAALDQSLALVTYAANPSGKRAAGVLLNDMVNIDQTRQHINWHKNEVQKGGKVTLLKRGWVVTDRVAGTPAVNDIAYCGPTGYFRPTQDAASIANLDLLNPKVGTFGSRKDEDGFAKVFVNID